MSVLEDVARGLYGAWRLFQRDPAAARLFGDTPEAAWRSFQAAVVAAPAYALLILLRPEEGDGSESDLHFILVELLIYLIGWLAFPLAAYYLATLLDCLPRFCRYVVAYNWANVLQIVVFVPVVALGGSEAVPEGLAAVVGLAVSVLLLWYMWFVARTLLEIDGLQAAGFLFVDVLISITLSNLAESLHLGTL